MTASNAYNPRYAGPDAAPVEAPCAWPDCADEGRYRAPKSRDNLREYHLFCLDHVRAYNARWNYFEGMTSAEIDAFRHDDLTGHRPTWRVGVRASPLWARLRSGDAFGLFGAGRHHASTPVNGDDSEERHALETLGLDDPVNLAELKSRFKLLVKRHHPDANAGDRAAGERLRMVIQAYRTLLARLRR
ncbi:MAG: J domain-containing protein [Alphaproteobacteria bacterium]